MDGQGSENFAARTDTMSSEGFVSGDDRHGRHVAKENTHNKGEKCRKIIVVKWRKHNFLSFFAENSRGDFTSEFFKSFFFFVRKSLSPKFGRIIFCYEE